MRFLPLAPVCLVLLAAPLAAGEVFHGSAHALRASPRRVPHGPVVDGALDDAVWAEAAVLDSFTHWNPVEGVPDTLGTECLLLYDDLNLYVGFRCREDPSGLRAPLVTRDDLNDDFAGIDLDTYNDRWKSYLFGCDPNGIQMDGVYQEGGGDPDTNPDFLYVSKARRTAAGYEIEMAIPFKTLRFPSRDPLTFGFNAWRNVGRTGELMFWAPLTRNISSLHAQYGWLEGLAGVRPGRSLQITPTWTGSRLGDRDAGGRLADRARSRAGGSLALGLASNLTADLAVTPDFSQVEADAGVVDINQRFAIYFPEKRPFFLEGSEIWNTPLDLVYTRRIADPLYGMKLSGKVGRTTIGVLHALDRSAGDSVETLPQGLNPYRDHDALYDLVRVRREVLKNSSVGLLLGDREQQETYNRGIGADGRFTFAEKYSLALQHVRSWSRERDLRGAVAGLDPAQRGDLDTTLLDLEGRIRQGNASRLSLARGSKGLDTGTNLTDISRHFAADMGFIQRTNQIDAQTFFNPHFYSNGRSWFTEVTPAAFYERTWEHGDDRWAGRLADETLNLGVNLDLPLNTWLKTWAQHGFTRFDGREFPHQRRWGLDAGSSRYQAVGGEISMSAGDAVVFDETVPGRGRDLSSRLNLRFSRRLDAELDFNGSIVERRETGTRFADVAISRVRMSFLFDKELSLRWISEYRSERDYDALGDGTEGKRALSLDLLGRYFVRPGTAVYVGYGARIEGAEARGMIPHTRNAFVKLSYLWQE